MDSNHLVALSPAAMAQLGGNTETPVRVRRVNPPEAQRMMLRRGDAAPLRMDTPSSLLTVLRRRLPESGSASLAANAAPPQAIETVEVAASAATPAAAQLPATEPAVDAATPTPAGELAAAEPVSEMPAAPAGETPPEVAAAEPVAPVAPVPAPADPAAEEETFAAVFETEQPAQAVAVAEAVQPPEAVEPAEVVEAPEGEAAEGEAVAQAPQVLEGGFLVQAATFANSDNAQRAANALGGQISQSGEYYRVRTGPFATRGEAEASLANVRRAGYSDARILTSG